MERTRKDGIESKAQKARKASVSPVAATGEKRSGSDEEQEKKTPKKVSFQRLSMGYKKDILAVFAYDFELSQFSVKYRLTPK